MSEPVRSLHFGAPQENTLDGLQINAAVTDAIEKFQFSGLTTIILFVLFFGGTFLLTLTIRERKENVDGFMVSSGAVGFGLSSSSMTATWIWAASFYAAATAGFTYGISGPVHYGLWGALMILCIYPFGKRFREVAPNARTLAEVIQARHGSSSQLLLAGSNIVGSIISLTANFTAAGALVYVLTPYSFKTGVLIVAIGVLGYTIWSGFRAAVLTDFVQLVALMGAAAIIIPWVFFAAGGTDMLSGGMDVLRNEGDGQKADFFSMDAFLNQGAPYMAAVLAYAIGNQTIAQRLFAVRKDKIKSTFVTASFGYAGTVIGLGMLGVFMAMQSGVEPLDGDANNIIPQMAVEYLPAGAIALLFIMVIGSLASTADSDLSAMASITMTDFYGKNLARGKINPQTMLLIGRMTMVGASAAGVAFAFSSFDILDLLVFVGALWGALVFPVIASFYWGRITNVAFSVSVAVALVIFILVRFEWIPFNGVIGVLLEIFAALGIATAVGLLAFGFLGRLAGIIVAAASFVAMLPLVIGFLRDYHVLMGSLVAYGVSALLCILISLTKNEDFDFAVIDERVLEFQKRQVDAATVTAQRKTERKATGGGTDRPGAGTGGGTATAVIDDEDEPGSGSGQKGERE